VRNIKGKHRPVVNESDRAGVVAGLESVDYVVKFGEDTPERLIRALRPDILVKGSDWKNKGIVGADFIKCYGGKVFTVDLAKGRSTTNIIRKIIETS
jgi:D-beta-D-heptose 7-phosphate kinase/D-beta-D-heptose 1-phosphate adenosyltransferase